MRRYILLLPAIFIALIFINAGLRPQPIPPKGKAIQTELYFGLSKQHGGHVSIAEWNSFADTVISIVFINGMTVHDCEGQWFDSKAGTRITENTRLVVAVSEMTKELSAQIDTVRAKYCRYYDQASVLRIDQRVKMNY